VPALLIGALFGGAGCADLTLASISPGLVAEGAGADVQVTGSGFDDGLQLSLIAPGLDVALGNVQVSSATEASAQVAAATPAGLYDLRGELGGLVAELPGALEVVGGGTRIIFLDIGQGDATLVISPSGEVLLIDGGPPGSGADLERALERETDGRLDAVVLSHFDADHLAGIVELLSGPDRTAGNDDDLFPDVVLGPDDDGGCDTQVCGRFRLLRAYPFQTPAPGDTLDLGDVDVEIVAADGDVGAGPISGASDNNERSVVVMLRYAGRSVLVTGDLTGGGLGTADLETPLAQQTGPVDVLRVGHHGSGTSSAQSALAAWQPIASVFSFGTDNRYCHPDPDVLARVAAASQVVVATGAGIVDDVDDCGAATVTPAGGRLGLGDIELIIAGDGSMTLAGDAL
jgi:beta-lactamase superfamily II metal-dependent hydrolase